MLESLINRSTLMLFALCSISTILLRNVMGERAILLKHFNCYGISLKIHSRHFVFNVSSMCENENTCGKGSCVVMSSKFR